MTSRIPFALVATMLLGTAPVVAKTSDAFGYDDDQRAGKELPAYLQCVPYAREVSGIQIYGDAHTWWDQAAGKFERGDRPKVGAVMAFQPYRNMQLGHVAAVSKIIDSRTVLLRHANWSPINGQRGQIENDVRAIDVSQANDWSEVRVWYDPIQGLGRTPWPIHGFIYPAKARSFTQPQRIARSSVPAVVAPPRKPDPQFVNAFANLEAKPNNRFARVSAPVRKTVTRSVAAQPVVDKPLIRTASISSAPSQRRSAKDDFSDVLAKYDR